MCLVLTAKNVQISVHLRKLSQLNTGTSLFKNTIGLGEKESYGYRSYYKPTVSTIFSAK